MTLWLVSFMRLLYGDTIDPHARAIAKNLQNTRDQDLQFLNSSSVCNHHHHSQWQALKILLVGYALIGGDQSTEALPRGEFEQGTVPSSCPAHFNYRVDLKCVGEVSRQASWHRLAKQQLHGLAS